MAIIDDLKFIDDGLTRGLNELALNKIEYWDIRCSVSTGTALDFTDQKSKEISSFSVNDCGIRTFINGGWGFTVLKDLSKKAIINEFSRAIKLAQLSESLGKNKFKIRERDPLIKNFKATGKENLVDVDIEEKISLIKQHEKIAAEFSPEIKNTRTLYMDKKDHCLFLNSFGSYLYQDLSYLRMYNLVYAQKNGIIQRAVNSVGGIGGFEINKTETAKNLSMKTAKEALALLDAKSPVGGKFTVIMDPEFTGVLIHETQHASEADLVLNKESVLEGMIGKKIGIEDVNIIDDPRMGQGKKLNLPFELYGSYFVDDEGVLSQRTPIIENGILKTYLHNLETASRMTVAPNGHGRATSPSSRPQVRMGFTYLEPKDWTLEEMYEDVKEGILCEGFNYGYCDPSTGNFQFKTKISYRIENGEKKEMMRDVSLSGMLLETLNKITAIGKNIGHSDGICGKGGQSVRVCDGGPFMKVDDVLVGGLN